MADADTFWLGIVDGIQSRRLRPWIIGGTSDGLHFSVVGPTDHDAAEVRTAKAMLDEHVRARDTGHHWLWGEVVASVKYG